MFSHTVTLIPVEHVLTQGHTQVSRTCSLTLRSVEHVLTQGHTQVSRTCSPARSCSGQQNMFSQEVSRTCSLTLRSVEHVLPHTQVSRTCSLTLGQSHPDLWNVLSLRSVTVS